MSDEVLGRYQDKDGEDYLFFTSWRNPWYDNGESLKKIIETAQKKNDMDYWAMVCFLLVGYLKDGLIVFEDGNDVWNEVFESFEKPGETQGVEEENPA